MCQQTNGAPLTSSSATEDAINDDTPRCQQPGPPLMGGKKKLTPMDNVDLLGEE